MPSESLYSLLFRTVKANYFTHSATILKEIGPTLYINSCNYMDETKAWYPEYIKMVQELEYNYEKFTLNQFDALLIHDKRLGKQQRRFLYHLSDSKYCPECLKESLYHRLYWDIRFVTVCTIHRKYLLESCVYCKKKSKVSRIVQDECKCGICFSQVTNEESIPSQEELDIQEELQSMILGSKQEILVENKECLTREQYFQLFILFCHLVDNLKIDGLFKGDNHFDYFNYGMKVQKEKNVLSFSILTSYVHLLITNPSKYMNLILKRLDDKQQVTKGIRKYKLQLFYKIINHEFGDIYQKLYKSYLSHTNDYYVNRKKYVKLDVREKSYVTREEVVTLYEIPIRRVNFLCEKGVLLEKKEHGVRLIDKKSVEDYVNNMKDSMNKIQVAAVLGVSSERVIDLVMRGKLHALYGPKINGWSTWVFHEDEVNKTLNWFLVNSVYVDEILEGYISFKRANTLLRHIGVDTLDLIELFATGKLESIVLKNEPNVKGIYLKQVDINEIIERERQKRITQYGYNLKETAIILNQDIRKIKQLVIQGELQTKHVLENPNGSQSYYFDEEYINKLVLNLKKYC